MPDPKTPEKTKPSVEIENAAQPPAESSAGAQESPPAVSTGAMAEELARVRAEKDELWQTLIRRQADFENYRKRLERERQEEGQRALARLMEGLLPVLDAFERALAAHDDPSYADYREGFQLIYRQLRDELARHGLERIDADGKRFDPYYHHAVERVESAQHDDGAILEVLQPGYLFRGRMLRPASVRVAVHPAAKTAETDERPN